MFIYCHYDKINYSNPKRTSKIDAVLPTMGGQTALNLCLKPMKKEFGKILDVKLIGVDINAINITEDREQFKQLLEKLE
jgi:carbamoyl-phosphate synthase large subunit